ncbi:hypothetical protein CDAR_381191 [Caerostris darwini]|uniref:Uncharacterized protein n=1 Tax=Caerostris darwini TaxID=1538125 RepID=A0AAV4PAH4_9ARAC|nr:hypothetical protein CDAR_381191 [Caerostris darwini]
MDNLQFFARHASASRTVSSQPQACNSRQKFAGRQAGRLLLSPAILNIAIQTQVSGHLLYNMDNLEVLFASSHKPLLTISVFPNLLSVASLIFH